VGSFSCIGGEIAKLGSTALLVTGKKVMRKSGILSVAEKRLSEADLKVVFFDHAEPGPSSQTMDRGAELAWKERCDFIVGVGGGSAMDCAKGIAVAAGAKTCVWNCVRSIPEEAEVLPIIAVPTTAGTGCETTPYAAVTNKELNRKNALASMKIYPRIAIVDPVLMRSMDPGPTASTGCDALVHAFEAYTSKRKNTVAEALALKALEFIYTNLERAYQDGNDFDARSAMALGSSLAGVSIGHMSTGLGHALAMGIGSYIAIPHGRVIAPILPHLMHFNRESAEADFAEVSRRVLGRSFSNQRLASSALVDRTIEIIGKIGLFPEDKIDVESVTFNKLVEDVMTRGSIRVNPRTVEREHVVEILERIFAAELP
jgi:alcohol dehydrogenase class IV